MPTKHLVHNNYIHLLLRGNSHPILWVLKRKINTSACSLPIITIVIIIVDKWMDWLLSHFGNILFSVCLVSLPNCTAECLQHRVNNKYMMNGSADEMKRYDR